MENPASWGRAEHVINDALREHDEAVARKMIGWSRAMVVADALRREGLLVELPSNQLDARAYPAAGGA